MDAYLEYEGNKLARSFRNAGLQQQLSQQIQAQPGYLSNQLQGLANMSTTFSANTIL